MRIPSAHKFGSMPPYVLSELFRKVADNHAPNSSCTNQAAVGLTAPIRSVTLHCIWKFIYQYPLFGS